MNPVLQSEGFERAAYTVSRAVENAGTDRLEEAARMFERSVDKLARILGMQAENDQRKALGHSMAYTEVDFVNA